MTVNNYYAPINIKPHNLPLRGMGGDTSGFVRLFLVNFGPRGVGRLNYASKPKNME